MEPLFVTCWTVLGDLLAAAHGEKTRDRFVKRCAGDFANGLIDIFRAVQEGHRPECAEAVELTLITRKRQKPLTQQAT